MAGKKEGQKGVVGEKRIKMRNTCRNTCARPFLKKLHAPYLQAKQAPLTPAKGGLYLCAPCKLPSVVASTRPDVMHGAHRHCSRKKGAMSQWDSARVSGSRKPFLSFNDGRTLLKDEIDAPAPNSSRAILTCPREAAHCSDVHPSCTNANSMGR
jgi:hypothetical protein